MVSFTIGFQGEAGRGDLILSERSFATPLAPIGGVMGPKWCMMLLLLAILATAQLAAAARQPAEGSTIRTEEAAAPSSNKKKHPYSAPEGFFIQVSSY
jgi:hypothetical protein